jgi:hypothetical protein
MKLEDAVKEIWPWLALQPKELHSEFTYVTDESLGRNMLYHMSTDVSIKCFQPNVTSRTAIKENRSVPRICTADTIIGCILGYAQTTKDFFTREEGEKALSQKEYKYRGGWVVYGIPFELAIIPSKKLLPDVTRTNEHWLVGYHGDAIDYPCQQIAKMFYTNVNYSATDGFPKSTIDLMFEVMSDEPIAFTPDHLLDKGHYCIRLVGIFSASNIKRGYDINIEKIDKVDYKQQKDQVASMLSFESLPPSARW